MDDRREAEPERRGLLDDPPPSRRAESADGEVRRGELRRVLDPEHRQPLERRLRSLAVEVLDKRLHPETGGLGDEVEHLRGEMMRAEHDKRLNRCVHVEPRFYHLVR